MIRIRHALQRGCTHPVLGPIVVVVLALLLCLVFLHAAEQGLAAFSELGLMCVALVAALGVALTDGTRGFAAVRRVLADRGPPRAGRRRGLDGERAFAVADLQRSLPLRN